MKIASLILGLIGGIYVLIYGIYGLFVWGTGAGFSFGSAPDVAKATLLGLLFGILGTIGGALALTKPKPAGILMLISGFGGIILVSQAYVVAGIPLIVGGILSLAARNRGQKE